MDERPSHLPDDATPEFEEHDAPLDPTGTPPADATVDATRLLIRLLGELSEPQVDLNARKRRLLAGIADAIGADTWSWALTRTVQPGNMTAMPITVSRLDWGWTPEQQAIHVRAQQSPHRRIFAGKMFADFSQLGQATFRREDMLSDDAWRSSDYYREFAGPLGCDEFILSAYRVTSVDTSAVVLYRKLGRPGFSLDERRAIELLMQEVAWVHRDETPPEATTTVVSLAPRERQVLHLLQAGDGRKQIAAKLGISEHTVADYTKSVYRHFKVTSRGELQALFLQGRTGR